MALVSLISQTDQNNGVYKGKRVVTAGTWAHTRRISPCICQPDLTEVLKNTPSSFLDVVFNRGVTVEPGEKASFLLRNYQEVHY